MTRLILIFLFATRGGPEGAYTRLSWLQGSGNQGSLFLPGEILTILKDIYRLQADFVGDNGQNRKE